MGRRAPGPERGSLGPEQGTPDPEQGAPDRAGQELAQFAPATVARPIGGEGEDERQAPPFSPRDVGTECFQIVSRDGHSAEARLWNEYVERYHYLRYGIPVGPHIKYFIHVHDEPIALMAFGGAAWKTAPRDQWIGWSRAQREANLHLVVNNTRFLILPWIRIDNLASRLLSLAAKRLPEDWNLRYAYRPLLLETFVHAERHAGTCYRAANWIHVGITQGRGKTDRHMTLNVPIAAGGRNQG